MSKLPETARQSFLTGLRTIEVKEFSLPEVQEGEILIKVEGCGICGTDVHEYKGDPFGLIPVGLGHEGTGEIVKLGANVLFDSAGKAVQVGDKVVTGLTPCGECFICKNHPDRVHLCGGGKIYGLLPDDERHFNGWFGEYLLVRADSVFFNVSGMDLDLRLLIEPSAVIIHSLERAKSTGLFKFNSNVLIQGCGPIGLLQLAAVRTMGVEHIIAVDGDGARLEMAKKLGADYCINIKEFASDDAIAEEIKKITGGLGADVAFQCTGSPKAASSIWKYIRRGGALCELGFFVNNGEATYNPHLDICMKEITAVGSWTYQAQDWLTAIDFLKRAQAIGLPITDLITHRYGLDDLNEAMETNIKLEGIKIVFIPNA